MTMPACSHPEDSREPLPYDGRNVADPDDWRCGECGATNLRLDRRSYADRVAAAEAERLAEIEFERFEERQRPAYEARTVRTKEGSLTVALPLPPTGYFVTNEGADFMKRIAQASGIVPSLTQTIDNIDVTSIFASREEAITVVREKTIEGGFDPARDDADLTATVYAMRQAGGLLLKRVDHVEFAHDLFRRAMRMSGMTPQVFSLAHAGSFKVMDWPLERKDLPSFAFRVVGS